MNPFATVYLDETGFRYAKEQAKELDKTIGCEVSLGSPLKDGNTRGWINIHTHDENIVQRAAGHFASHVTDISRSWED